MNYSMEVDDSSDSTASLEESLPESPYVEIQEDDQNNLATNTPLMESKLFRPLPGQEVIGRVRNTWSIDNWTELPQRSHGPYFECGGFRFRLLVFPQGNNTRAVSLYLEAEPKREGEEGYDQAESQSRQSEQLQPEQPQQRQQPQEQQHQQQQLQSEQQQQPQKDWHICAQFGLVMWNPDDPSVYCTSYSQHRFTPDEKDWGFTNFVDFRTLYNKVAGAGKPALIENNKVNIDVHVRVIADPTGVLWHNFINYDSKKETGYIGMTNQGATCYLNSLLQSLYFTKVFRNTVYQIPTENDKPLESVPLALQRLFYQIKTSKDPVSTTPLTQSFGWDTADAFTQHDVQELNRVLMDKLEGKMKGTSVEGALNDIFVAQMRSFVRCVNVDFESSRVEDYWDIQLNVKGMSGIEDSFRDYVQVEMLQGENQYMATGYGLQDAKKGVTFLSFPPVLHLQLKRYEYDFERDMMIKNNDRYEFPLEIDLSEFVEHENNPAAKSEPWIYELHGVLVHSGDLNAGHYYALLKPEKNGDWFRFDDDRVTRASLYEVLEENFGGEPESLLPPGVQLPQGQQQQRPLSQYKRHSSAYMLVYIRKSRLDQVLPAGEESIPQHIPLGIQLEEQERLARRRLAEEQHLYTTIQVCLPEHFKKYHGLDFVDWKRQSGVINGEQQKQEGVAPIISGDSPLIKKVRKSMKLGELKAMLYEEVTGQSLSDIDAATAADLLNRAQLWLFSYRENNTCRPSELIKGTVGLERTISFYPSRSDFRVYFDPNPTPLISKIPKQNQPPLVDPHLQARYVTLYIKYYDPAVDQLRGLGSLAVEPLTTIEEIGKYIEDHYFEGGNGNEKIQMFEEVCLQQVDGLSPKKSTEACELGDGDIICFERVPADSDNTSPSKLRQHYEYLENRILIRFTEWKNPQSHYGGRVQSPQLSPGGAAAAVEAGTPQQFLIWLSRKDTYDVMVQAVADRLHIEGSHLRLFNRRPLARTGTLEKILRDPIQNQYGDHHNNNIFDYDLYYEILPMTLTELENTRVVPVLFLTEGTSNEHRLDIGVPKTATLSAVYKGLAEEIQALREQQQQQTNGEQRPDEQVYDAEHIKMWGVIRSRIHRVLNPTYPVDSLPDAMTIYASIYPTEEYEFMAKTQNAEAGGGSPSNMKMIQVVHYQRDPNRMHGVPFTFIILEGENFSDTKVRLQKATGLYDKAFEKVRFSIVDNEMTEITDDDSQLFNMMASNGILGLDHVDRNRRGYNQAIVIK